MLASTITLRFYLNLYNASFLVLKSGAISISFNKYIIASHSASINLRISSKLFLILDYKSF